MNCGSLHGPFDSGVILKNQGSHSPLKFRYSWKSCPSPGPCSLNSLKVLWSIVHSILMFLLKIYGFLLSASSVICNLLTYNTFVRFVMVTYAPGFCFFFWGGGIIMKFFNFEKLSFTSFWYPWIMRKFSWKFLMEAHILNVQVPLDEILSFHWQCNWHFNLAVMLL